jgi:ATP-dependent DNA helicase RecG
MIEIFRNKIIISNPGGLVSWLAPSDFGKYSRTRNELIASLLMRTIYVEKMGTGILRINNALKDHGLPNAEFEFDENNFAIILKDNTDKVTDNQKQIIEEKQSTQETTQETTQESTQKTDQKTDQKADQKTDQKTDRHLYIKKGTQADVLSLLSENPYYTKKNLMEILGKSRGTINEHIIRLKKAGLLKRIGPDKGGHWEVI